MRKLLFLIPLLSACSTEPPAQFMGNLPPAKVGQYYSYSLQYSEWTTICDFTYYKFKPTNIGLQFSKPKEPYCLTMVLSGVPTQKGVFTIEIEYNEKMVVAFHRSNYTKSYQLIVE